jgi:pSer/pThr/pTyr-binding forkhead associated (FHA) protein
VTTSTPMMQASLQQHHPDPPWSRPPQHEWVLTEVKDGVEVATHRLDCRSVVLGRAADQVHITLAHPSISRHHARIAFDGQGTPWLRDLQSTHGVTINKKAYPKVAIGRNESDSTKPGARGVVLYPGDVLQFGASTRIFCLEGPEEFARGAIRPATEKILDASVNTNSTSARTASAKELDLAEQPVAQDDKTDGEDSDWRQTRPLTDETVPEQYQKEWEKIKALQYKLANVTTESERIRVKEDLSAGQERQLERNEERIQQLTEQIHQKENELYRKVYPDTANQYLAQHRHDRLKDQQDGDDVEDDFFDRTKSTTESTLIFNKDGESEQSLIAKWNALSEQREELLKDTNTCRLKVSALQQKLERISTESPDDLFFAQNEYELAHESYLKLQTKAEVIHGHLLEIQQLIALANPKLKLVNGQWTTTTATTIATHTNSAPLIVAADATSAEANPTTCPIDHTMNSRLQNDVIPSPVLPATPSSCDRDSLPLPHREKRQRLDSLSAMPPPAPLHHRAKQQSANTASSTLTAVSFLHPGSAAEQPLPAEAHPTVSTNTPRLSVLTGKDDLVDAWQVPKDQDGSGRTRLNDKFAGRY